MKVLNLKAYSKRIEEIRAIQDKKSDKVIIIAVDTWVDSDDESACFADYANRILSKASKKSIVFIDDMEMGSNGMYLPYEPLHFLDKQSIKPFMECFDDAPWLKMYVAAVEELIESGESLYDIENAAFQDFLQNYKTMSIEAMVERYSDPRWFTGNK